MTVIPFPRRPAGDQRLDAVVDRLVERATEPRDQAPALAVVQDHRDLAAARGRWDDAMQLDRHLSFARYGAARDALISEVNDATRRGDRERAEQSLEHLRVLAEELRRDERNTPGLDERELDDAQLDEVDDFELDLDEERR